VKYKSHPTYERLIHKARRSHEQGRSTAGIDEQDVVLARLYCYAYRTHTIGAFHATRRALASVPVSKGLCSAYRTRAIESLDDLANVGMDPVPGDFRALTSMLYRYDCCVCRVIESLENEQHESGDESLGRILTRFRESVERITNCCGIYVTRDTDVPAQASFDVPRLGIVIVPLVYGDHHSWNLAVVPPDPELMTTHRHYHGVEIHLGYKPLHGYTILGDCCAEVEEGYAMPIRPLTVHGYTNMGCEPHRLPFVFGSLKHAGWGVFFDVDPQPRPVGELKRVPLESDEMNGTVYLDREIAVAESSEPGRRIIVPSERTAGDSEAGALELAVARVDQKGMDLTSDTFRIVSIVRGSGLVQIAGIETTVSEHDHFGVPAGVGAYLKQEGDAPLVALDAVIRPV